jgi:fructose-bisphosphate aldolase class II
VASDGERFDRVQILSEVEAPIEAATRRVLRNIGPE